MSSSCFVKVNHIQIRAQIYLLIKLMKVFFEGIRYYLEYFHSKFEEIYLSPPDCFKIFNFPETNTTALPESFSLISFTL